MLNFFSNYNVVNRAFELPDPSVIASKRVLITTCGAAGILRCGDYGAYHRAAKAKRTSSFLDGLEFSHVLIDEAGQVTSLLLLHRHFILFVQVQTTGCTDSNEPCNSLCLGIEQSSFDLWIPATFKCIYYSLIGS